MAGGVISATARLKKDFARLMKDPVPFVLAAPLPANILEWHYVVTGPPDSPYSDGIYHGKLVFPGDFPFKPPAIYMLTPNGRFQTKTRLCLSISDFHPDTWNPAWTVSTILTGLLSFMLENQPTLGSIQTSDREKRVLARRSREYNLKDKTFCDLFPELAVELREELEKEATARLGETQPSTTGPDSSSNPSSDHSFTYNIIVFAGVVSPTSQPRVREELEKEATARLGETQPSTTGPDSSSNPSSDHSFTYNIIVFAGVVSPASHPRVREELEKEATARLGETQPSTTGPYSSSNPSSDHSFTYNIIVFAGVVSPASHPRVREELEKEATARLGETQPSTTGPYSSSNPSSDHSFTYNIIVFAGVVSPASHPRVREELEKEATARLGETQPSTTGPYSSSNPSSDHSFTYNIIVFAGVVSPASHPRVREELEKEATARLGETQPSTTGPDSSSNPSSDHSFTYNIIVFAGVVSPTSQPRVREELEKEATARLGETQPSTTGPDSSSNPSSDHSFTYNIIVFAGVVALAFAVRYVLISAASESPDNPA